MAIYELPVPKMEVFWKKTLQILRVGFATLKRLNLYETASFHTFRVKIHRGVLALG